MRLISILILLFFLSCGKKNCESLDSSISELMYLLEETNRLDLKEVVVSYHLTDDRTNMINNFIIEVYVEIDKVTEDLLLKSGGYSENGVLLGADNAEVGSLVFNDHNIINKICFKLSEFKSELEKTELPYKKETTKELESILLPFFKNGFNDKYLSDASVAKLYLQLLIIQNRLLVAEVKYFEKLRSSETL
ncbi:MAG: hypothetical protein LAT68_17045 [Cyclobacteriaceae bacterium]|nr:hypothetical protein [Cyclobacteriaceae bacterium]MCH8518009.1 hypothetical protein [Cyclobacteriaceae bacterium]